MRKWVGLKNYVQRKLREAIFAAVVGSGRSFVAAKTVIAATLPSPVGVWLSHIMSPIVNRNVVLKWTEATGERIINLVWNRETIARVHSNLTQFEASQLQKKKEAEKKIDEAGIGECSFCHEEIMKNKQQIWETSFLLAYCLESKDHKHSPKVRWEAQ